MEDLEALLEGDPRVMRAVQSELGRHRLCDDCLGRQLGKVDHGSNVERGRIMREMADPKATPVRPENCHLCEGLVEEYDDLAAEVQHALEGMEWNTFLIGTKAPKRVTQLEVDLMRLFPSVWVESFKAEVNREVGRRVEAATGNEANFDSMESMASRASPRTASFSCSSSLRQVLRAWSKRPARAAPTSESSCSIRRGSSRSARRAT